MPARWRAPARPNGGGRRPRASSIAVLIPLVATLLVHAASAADPPPAARSLDGSAARGAGLAVELVPRADVAAGVLEVRPAPGSSFGGVVLDAASDASAAALSDGRGLVAGGLLVARADGSQLRVALDGVLDATFTDDAARLAVVDGIGRLWLVDSATGAAQTLADGPFLAAPVTEPDGSVLALAVPSIEAPFRSRLVRVAPDGTVGSVSEEELVYDVTRLADGSLAIVSHRPAGTVVHRLAQGVARLHAELGPDAVNVSLSRNGEVIAWESAGQAFARRGASAVRALGAGSRPAVTADGTAVLLEREGASILVDLEGEVLATLAAASVVVGCDGECGS
jgi:hypothetical protein